MRRLSEPEAHRGRVQVIEGRYPEGMKARCAWCGEVTEVAAGKMLSMSRSGGGATRAFKCNECLDADEGTAA